MVTKEAPERLSDLGKKINNAIEIEIEKQKENEKIIDDLSNDIEYDNDIEYHCISE